jgi:hypothetical protein
MHAGLDHRAALGVDLPPIEAAEMTVAMRRAQHIARLLAPRLDVVVPRPFSVRAANEFVAVYRAEQRVARQNLIDLDADGAVHRVLEGLQDFFTEELTVPWPHDPDRGYAFHMPEVEIRGDALSMCYGDADKPAMMIEPIPMVDPGDE